MTGRPASNLLAIFAVVAVFSINTAAIEFKGMSYTAWGWDIYSTPDSDQSLANTKDAGCTQ